MCRRYIVIALIYFGCLQGAVAAGPLDPIEIGVHYSFYLGKINNYNFDNQASEKSARITIVNFLKDTVAYIPKKFKDSLSGRIIIEFDPLTLMNKDKYNQLVFPYCSTEAKDSAKAGKKRSMYYGMLSVWDQARGPLRRLGQSNSTRRFALHSLFVPEILAGPEGGKKYPCGHRTAYRLAQATLIHELAHIFDEDYKDPIIKGRISKSKEYRLLADFGSCRFSKTMFTPRSADPFETKSCLEHFAVNAEFFLLDPEYKCRKPSLYRKFSELWDVVPFPDSNCAVNTTIYAGKEGLAIDLNPDRIYSVDYFLADSGKKLEQKWGHSMLRLVVCDPRRKIVGPDCRKDTKFHIIVNYAAFYTRSGLSKILSGLFGKYPLELYMTPFRQILTEYNFEELRDTYSLPLVLSAQEKQNLIYEIIDNYWTYVGKYKFISQNCATETRDILSTSFEDNDFQSVKENKPKNLLHALFDQNRINLQEVEASSHLTSTELATLIEFHSSEFSPELRQKLHQGRFFSPSKIEAVATAMDILNGIVFHKNLNDPYKYLEHSDFRARRQSFETLDLVRGDKALLLKQLSALEVIEVLQASQKFRILKGSIEEFMFKNRKNPDVIAIKEKMSTLNSNIMPFEQIDGMGTYGIPTLEEVNWQSGVSIEAQQAYFKDLQEFLSKHLELDFSVIQEMQNNIAAYAQAYREVEQR